MKNLKLIDILIIIAFVLALGVGFLTYKHFRQTAGGQIESTSKIAFQVYLRGVTITGGYSPVRPGDQTFISIRNVPYTALRVIDAKTDTKKTVIPNPKGNTPFTIVDDYSQMFMYDIVVTIIDTAKITKDGAIVGGNKIKIGLPITLEGIDYKFNGTVSNIQMLTDAQAKQTEDALDNMLKQAAAKKQQPAPAAQANQPQQQPQPQNAVKKDSKTPVKNAK